MQRMKEHGASGVAGESSSASSTTTLASTVVPTTASLSASPAPAQSPSSFEYAENLIRSGQ